MCKTKWGLGLKGSILIANPLPTDKEVSPETIEIIIKNALAEADKNNIKGKEVTPFLLKYIAQNSKGESLEANIELILNNAALAGKIAAAM
jgi:pseudouridine-5'-phosphate glycosidase